MNIRLSAFLSIFFYCLSVSAQSVVDECFTSAFPGTSFSGSPDLVSIDADLLNWTGSSWTGAWQHANVTKPPPVNLNSCRAIWIGNGQSWTTGGEGFGLRLDQPLVAGQSYSFPFTYVSHGVGSTGSFSLRFLTNSVANYNTALFVGILPAVGTNWTTNTFTFTATAAQAGHTWIFLHNGSSGTSGMVNSMCANCNPVPSCSVNLGPDQLLCQGQNTTLNAATAGASYLWQDGSTSSTFNVTQSGTYWVQITVGACTDKDSIDVMFNPLPSVNLGNDTSLCSGSTLILDPRVLGAIYQWQDNSTGTTFNVSSSGTYWVNVTKNNCSNSDTITVVFDQSPLVDLGNDTIICNQDSLLLNAFVPGGSYLWQDNSTNTTFNVTQAGTYWVAVTVGGCTSIDTIVVSYNQSPVFNLGNDTTLCSGSSLMLDPGILFSQILWQNGSSAPQFQVTQQGTYYSTVTLNGCSSTDTIQVAYITVPPLDLGNDTVICGTSTILLDAGAGFDSYVWHDNTASQTYLVSQTGYYSVDVIYQGCNARDTIYVSYEFSIDLGPDTTLCEGETLLLDPAISGASYVWQDMSTDQTYLVASAGTYYVTGQLNVCSSSDTIRVSYNPLPVVDLGPDTAICSASSLVLDVSQLNGSYLWNDQSTNSLLSVSQQGTYYVTVNVNGCLDSDTINVSYPVIVLDLGQDTTICKGDSISLDATNAGAVYAWQDGSTDSVYTAGEAGVYYVTVSKDGCVRSDSIEISIDPGPQFTLGNDTIVCAGEVFMLNAFVSGGSYIWQDNSSLSTYVVSQPGTYFVDVTQNNCSARDSIRVLYDVVPTIDLGSDLILCQGQRVILIAGQPGTTFIWQDNTVSPAYTVTASGTYWVKNANSTCVTNDTIVVRFDPLPVVDLGSDTTICQGGSFILDATVPGASYQWNDNTSSTVLETSSSGLFWVNVTTGNCTSSDSVQVEFRNVSADLGNDTLLCSDEILTLNAGAQSGSILWSTGATSAQITISEAGTYWVRITNGTCMATDSVDIQMEDCREIIEMPNVFSPNGDERNDKFVPVLMLNVEIIDISIFNRWGQKVFSSTDQEFSWDGKEGSRDCPDGTYFWVLNYSTDASQGQRMTGNVTLVR